MALWLLGVSMVGGAVGLSVGGLWVVRRSVSPALLREHHDVAGFILAIVGVIYAVLLAFAVLVVWEQFEDAKIVAERESNALVDVYRMAFGFPAPEAVRLRTDLRAFATSVIEKEWPAMARGEVDHESARRVDRIWADFVHLQPRGAREAALYDQCLSRMTEVSDNRRLRLLASRDGVPGPMWMVLIAGGVATMLFTYFFGVEKFANQAAMTALLAATVALVLFIICALNYPFSGDLSIGPDAMRSALERFDDIEAHARSG